MIKLRCVLLISGIVMFHYFNYTYAFEMGIGTHIANYNNKTPLEYIKEFKAYGFTSVRDELYWNDVEKNDGKFSIPENREKNDYLFTHAKDNGLTTLLVLDYGNRIHTHMGYPVSDLQIKNFASYAKWVANKYKGKVSYYEIWNEWPYGTGMSRQFKDNIPGPDSYFNLVKNTSSAIKSADPNATVVAGGFNPIKDDDVLWFNKLISLGIMKYIDGVSIHPYSYSSKDISTRSPEGNIKKIDHYEKLLVSITGKTVPLYITEIGYPTYHGNGGIDQKHAAANMITYNSLARQKDYIKGVWWYTFIDSGNNINSKEDNFGILNSHGDEKTSAYCLRILSEEKSAVDSKDISCY